MQGSIQGRDAARKPASQGSECGTPRAGAEVREWFTCMGKVAQGRLNHRAGRPGEAWRVEFSGVGRLSVLHQKTWVSGWGLGFRQPPALPERAELRAQAASRSSAARGQRGRRNPRGNVLGRGAQAARAGGTAAGDPRMRAAGRSHFRSIFFLAAAGMRSWVSGGAAAPSGGLAAGSRSPGRALACACHRGLGRIARMGGAPPTAP